MLRREDFTHEGVALLAQEAAGRGDASWSSFRYADRLGERKVASHLAPATGGIVSSGDHLEQTVRARRARAIYDRHLANLCSALDQLAIA